MQTVSIVFAVVAVVCALIATVAARRCGELYAEISRLLQTVSTERGRLAAHDAELDQITETLRKLSGRIGAMRKEARGSDSSNGDESNVSDINRLTWKAEMRQKYGLTPMPRK